MAKTKVTINLPGINELMKSPEIQSSLSEAAEVVAKAAGSEYGHKGYVIRWIAVENVFPISQKGARDNLKNNTLAKALGASGLPLKRGK